MKVRLWFVLGAVFVVTMAGLPALAHHSFAAEFDRSKPVTLTGTVTKVEWANPHARFYIDVKDETGKVNNWDFELASPNGLMRRDWTRFSKSRRCRHGDRVGCEKLLLCRQYLNGDFERWPESVRGIIGGE